MERMSWRGLGSAGPDGDPKAREGIARPNTERRIHTLPCARRWCTGASTRESGIMLCTMRNPLVAVGAGDHCLLKLHRQPYMFACLVPTQIALRAFAPFEVCNQPKSAHRSSLGSGDCPCALSVSESTVRLGQDRLSGGRVLLWFGYQTIRIGASYATDRPVSIIFT